MALVSGRALCVAPNSTVGSADVGLSLVRCPGTAGGVDAAAAAFSLTRGKRGQVVHAASKKCLRGGEMRLPLLSACADGEPAQLWVFGASGRLCGVGGCLTVGWA